MKCPDLSAEAPLMPQTRRRRVAAALARIADPVLAKLPPAEQERLLTAFEEFVEKIKRHANDHSPKTPPVEVR